MSNDDHGYKLSVGIECHVQLKTKSKLFSGADNDAREAPANTLVNHIDFGLPGALPVLNKQAVKLAAKAAFALNSKPQKFSKFDRKHYFYPDLPMGYQISQYDEPIIIGGYVEFDCENKPMRVDITRAHIEADAGKSLHPAGSDYSLVDLNRAGTPLLEIVSEPEMHSPKQARSYAQQLYLLMRYADVSDANLYYGNMRFDVNVSVSKDDKLGTRSETKNLNSFRAVEKAVEYEMQRQIKLLEDGQVVVQETRGWDDNKNITYSMRSKENADDYRYMPDPDLPPMVLDDKFIDEIKQQMPMMPDYWQHKLSQLALDDSVISGLIFAEVDYPAKNLEFISGLPAKPAKMIANWIVNYEVPLRSQADEQSADFIDDKVRYAMYLAIYRLVNSSKLNSNATKQLVTKLLTLTKDFPKDIEDYISDLGLIQNSNSDELLDAVKKAIVDNPKAAEDIKAGELKAIGFLVGQVMKQTDGQANPAMVSEMIRTQLAV